MACYGEHDGATIITSDLATGEIGLAGEPPLPSVTDQRAPSVSLSLSLIFLFVFIDLNTRFKNSYLELRVSKLSEPNFVGFIMKYTI